MKPENKPKILITGGSGMIGHHLCRYLSHQFDVHSVDIVPNQHPSSTTWKSSIIDLTCDQETSHFFKSHTFDVIIHCAGTSRQVFEDDNDTRYNAMNAETTANLTKIAGQANPKALILFLSSVQVYGDRPTKRPLKETDTCFPDCGYSRSKHTAEQRLLNAFESNIVNHVHILRLAPVYGRDHSYNLDKRIFAPGRIAYLKIGTGQQKMSALSMDNLSAFIHFLILRHINSNGLKYFEIFNMTDYSTYSFSDIIQVFRSTSLKPNRFVLTIPLWMVSFCFVLLGLVFQSKKKWLESAKNKLSLDFIYDNTKMLNTGFKPKNNLESVFFLNDKQNL